jgi:hypothetical protein
MPWKCPACSGQIRHFASESWPRAGVTYRCEICKIDLVLDRVSTKLVLAPFPDPLESEDQKEERETRLLQMIESAQQHHEQAADHMSRAERHQEEARRLKTARSVTRKPRKRR